MSLLRDMLGVIAERGRALTDFTLVTQSASAVEQLVELGERLLSSRGEATGLVTASELLGRYEKLTKEERLQFCYALLERFGPDVDRVRSVVEDFNNGSAEAAERLHEVSEPRRQKLFRMLNQPATGTAQLIAMRADLLDALRQHPELKPVDRDFQHLFRSWFNRGFLELRRINWSTPAVVLDHIIRYEAVHEIADWDDLRRRIDPPDRRLYAFFHPSLPDEPLIFVEVALMRAPAASIREILDPAREIIGASEASTAVFYSISDCQSGLRGISFGNFLIKQVVEELRSELHHLNRFVTLSPMPGFSRWLAGAPLVPEARHALEKLEEENWHENTRGAAAIEQRLMALAAWYLIEARADDGRLCDPVARFHLGNGARLDRVNWLANLGKPGLRSSFGIMVNYVYELDDIERNHERFVTGLTPAASSAVRRLAKNGARYLTGRAGDKDRNGE